MICVERRTPLSGLKRIKAGDLVEAGHGTDHAIGLVVEIAGDRAYVDWLTERCSSWAPLLTLRHLGAY
jgi:hypothetical protein